jgi:hypothetical protein
MKKHYLCMSFSFGRMRRGDMLRSNADTKQTNADNMMAWRM